MHVDLTSEQKALQAELRDYFTNLMTDEVKASIRNDELSANEPYRELIRKIGADGWLGVAWPEEYGGKGYTPVENYIFFNEAQQAGCPIPFLTTNTVGPTLRNFGSEEQKNHFLPKILTGDMFFSIGYSEPGAGSDLASLQTRSGEGRRRVGDQRAEALHVAGLGRRLHLARRPHRSRCSRPQGDHDLPGPDERSRVLDHPLHHDGHDQHHGDVLRRRPRPSRPSWARSTAAGT
ncbi:MAG: acyl-CoA dehydrogenase family protein [Acidimicrobiales bacterium]